MSEGALCFDVVARLDEEMLIKSGEIKKVPLGIRIDTRDKDIGVFIASRSGIAYNNGVLVINGVGIIDSDFRGELSILLYNTGAVGDFIVSPFMRIGQLLFLEAVNVRLIEKDSLSETIRGTGGFGHTGTSNSNIEVKS